MNIFLDCLSLINVILSIITAWSYYQAKKVKGRDEFLYVSIAAGLLAIRYSWVFISDVWEVYNDFLLRLIGIEVFLIEICGLLWINKVFRLTNNSLRSKIINVFHWFTVWIVFVFMTISLTLPSDPVTRDVNKSTYSAFMIISILLSINVVGRMSIFWKTLSKDYQIYYIILAISVAFISIGGPLFNFLGDQTLRMVIPLIGLLLNLFAEKTMYIIPFLFLVRTTDIGICLVSTKNESIIYYNESISQYFPPSLTSKRQTIPLDKLWFNKEEFVKAYDQALFKKKPVAINDRLFSYKTGKNDWLQFTFYPVIDLSVSHSSNYEVFPSQLIIFTIPSERLIFLKERRDILYDIINHDIANVDQIIKVGLESLTKEDFTSEKGWRIREILLAQTKRMDQLVSSAQNLVIIDETDKEPSEYLADFNKRFITLINEIKEKYPNVKIITKNLQDIKPIKTTGHLKSGFKLLIESILSITDEIVISAKSNLPEGNQSIIFQFKSNKITEDFVDLLENYTIKRSEMVAAGSYRINFIVAITIIKKNGGKIIMKRSLPLNEHKVLLTVTLPIINQDK